MKLEWLKEVIGEAYTEELDKKAAQRLGELFVSRADFNILNDVKKELEQQLKERDKDISELKKSAGDNDELQSKYQALQDKYKTDTQALEKKILETKKDNAVDMAIMQAKGRNPKAIKALLDLDKISLKDDGSLEGLDLEALKKTDGYLFDTRVTQTVGTGMGKGVKSESSAAADIQAQFESALFGR